MDVEWKKIKYKPSLNILECIENYENIKLDICGFEIRIFPGHNNHGFLVPGYLRIMVYNKNPLKQLTLIEVFAKKYIEHVTHYEQNVTTDELSEMLLSLYNGGANKNGKNELKSGLIDEIQYAEPYGSWIDDIHQRLGEI